MNGVGLPKSPTVKDPTKLSEDETTQEATRLTTGTPHVSENDENRPHHNDPNRLCTLKERRLQHFYREQMINNNGKIASSLARDCVRISDTDEVSDLSRKTPVVMYNTIYAESAEYVKLHSNRLHHISRILDVDAKMADEAVNPLHGLKTLTNLLDDKTIKPGPSLQRRRSLSCSDLVEDNVLRNNDSNNNNEGEKSSGVDENDEDGAKVNHRCDDCGKTFGRRQLLVQHRRIHTGERPYLCGVCGKQFTQRGHWTAHQKLHEDSRQPEHSCSHCGKAFVTRASLKVSTRL